MSGFFDVEQREPEAYNNSALIDAERKRQRIQEDREEAERLKQMIERQLSAGAEPYSVLCTALKVIGLLSDDPAFTERTAEKIGSVYSDLTQLSFVQDNAAVAADRLRQRHAEYIDKARRGVTRQLNNCKKIEQALTDALAAINAENNETD